MIDLARYFERIAYTGSREPTLETLRALHLHHALAIPFENLDPLLGAAVPLDLASLQEKLVSGGRGGYCFEHNLLFMHVLEQLGFQVTGLAARVLWNAPPGAVRARNHMLLRVDLPDAIHLADVGFGGLTPTAPLRLAPGAEQPTPHERFRILAERGGFLMQARVGETWGTLYRFDLQPQLLQDYEAMSWYLCTHPGSHFRNTLFVARNAPAVRYVLLGNQLGAHHLDGPTTRQTLTSAAALRAALEGTFHIRLPASDLLDPVLERLTQP